MARLTTSPAFPSLYGGECWICQEEIAHFDLVVYDQDDQVIHQYCA